MKTVKKWRHLKDCYRKSQAKKRGKSGDSADCIPKKWKYEDEMSFLLPNLKERPQKSNITIPIDDTMNEQNENFEDEGGESSVDTHQDAFDDTTVLSPRSDILVTPSSSNTSTSTAFKPKKRAPKQELNSAEVLQKFLDNKEKRKRADHLTKFFESAEETTRSLPPDLQVEVKHRISTILYEFELQAMARSSLNSTVVDNDESNSPNYSVTKEGNKTYTHL